MGIIWTIIIGFVAGLIAKFVLPGRDSAAGVYLDDPSRHSGSFRCNIRWPSNRLVPSWRGRWAHWSRRRRNHRLGGVGLFRTSKSLNSLGAVSLSDPMLNCPD